MKKILLCFLFLNVFVFNYSFAEEPEQINVENLQQTTVTPYLDTIISNNKNLIYCSTFQLAWDALCDDIIKAPLVLAGNPEIQQILNKRLTGKKDIANDAYIAMAGFNKNGIIEKINQYLLKQFNNKKGCGITLYNPDDILAYSYLFKHLEFKYKFEDLTDTPIFFNNETKVQTFGIKKFSDEIAKQVKILDYINDDNFILQIESKSKNDEIILAKIQPKETLLKTVDYVFEQVKNKNPINLKSNDILKIPKFDFDILKKYSEIANRDIKNINFNNYYISEAIQVIKFKLNEKGVVLESYAGMVGIVSIGKRLIFDKPFLFCLKEKNGKYPYFVMWVDNAELMLKINNDK
ncbi:MAG: hypothetical protein PHV68_09820 [Candidatus Gastranaerophilales bacterium]|nr:hypothetical protein [Candidatus Gastranaerophilales bacterium]